MEINVPTQCSLSSFTFLLLVHFSHVKSQWSISSANPRLTDTYFTTVTATMSLSLFKSDFRFKSKWDATKKYSKNRDNFKNNEDFWGLLVINSFRAILLICDNREIRYNQHFAYKMSCEPVTSYHHVSHSKRISISWMLCWILSWVSPF